MPLLETTQNDKEVEEEGKNIYLLLDIKVNIIPSSLLLVLQLSFSRNHTRIAILVFFRCIFLTTSTRSLFPCRSLRQVKRIIKRDATHNTNAKSNLESCLSPNLSSPLCTQTAFQAYILLLFSLPSSSLLLQNISLYRIIVNSPSKPCVCSCCI